MNGLYFCFGTTTTSSFFSLQENSEKNTSRKQNKKVIFDIRFEDNQFFKLDASFRDNP